MLCFACSSGSSEGVLKFFFDGVLSSDTTKNITSVEEIVDTGSTKDPVVQLVTPTIFFHDPYKEKMCDNCHDKGYSNSTFMPPPELCYQCHEEFSSTFTNLHYPVDEGECNFCHNPHKSKYDNLLLLSISELCAECHDVDEIISGDLHEGINNDECMDCHNPHGSNDEALMN